MRIGVDIGGSKVIVGLLGEQGRVVEKRRIVLERRDYGYVRDRVVEEILRLAEGRAIKGVGIASAGQIEAGTQRILFSPNLGWQDVNLKADMEERLRTKVHVENDVNAATYGEWRFALRGEPKTVIGVYVGTGIGGGMILDGRLYRGSSNVGAEIGHMILDPMGPRCNCGRRGCFEALCGGSYIVRKVKERIEEGYRGRIYEVIEGDLDRLHTGHIEKAFLLGDALCEEVWEEVAFYLGCGLASLVNIFNPDVLLLGGGVIYGSNLLIDLALPSFEAYSLPVSAKNVKVLRATLREDAALMGASFLLEERD
jgi:glucokinase